MDAAPGRQESRPFVIERAALAVRPRPAAASPARPGLRSIVRVEGPLAVCLACAAGAALGSMFRFPRTGTAILYPPYAIVTAALLAAPPRRWWLYLLAGSAGTFGPHWMDGWPAGFVLLTDLANHLRALVAAWGIRRFTRDRTDLSSVKDMAVFLLFAAVLAPAAGAFVGAAVVAGHGGTGYWVAWPPWMLSNLTTGITVLPMILIARARLRADLDIGWASLVRLTARLPEAAGLAAVLVAVAGLVLLAPVRSTGGASLELYAPVPVLLWAAVRFGPGATSSSLLLVAALSVAGTLAGRGPYFTNAPADDLVRLQIFLFVTSVPLLLLSALVQQERRARRALRASQQLYESVVEDETDLICRFDPDGTLTFLNGACGRRAGRPKQDLLGTSFWSLFSPGERDERRRHASQAAPWRPTAVWEGSRPGGPGEIRWEQWTVRALFDDLGALRGFQALGRDTTEEKRAAAQRALIVAQESTTKALREADRRKDEFLAMVAHELRNPLAPIAIALETLRHLPSADADMLAARGIIDRQTAQLMRLVEDLLDGARISSGIIQVRRERVDIARVLTSAVEISQPVLSARRIDLVVDIQGQPPPISGDPARLAQLFSNLLNNGAKYSEVGGRVLVTVAADPGGLSVSVKDTGAGVPAHLLDRIFEPFMQVDRPRDGALGGVGLGLAVVRRLVELHGGSIRAHSAGPGHGSEFVVCLPSEIA
jgi:PAS domain S-box-containing protein